MPDKWITDTYRAQLVDEGLCILVERTIGPLWLITWRTAHMNVWRAFGIVEAEDVFKATAVANEAIPAIHEQARAAHGPLN